MKILILGGTGLLGNAVGKYFINSNHDITLTYRNEMVIYGDKKKWVYFDALKQSPLLVKEYDYVINCIGVIKPFMYNNLLDSIKLNSVFPWELANICEKTNTRLFHITTDCVYSGKNGKYNEDSLHDALDDYGKSKSLGEPIEKCMVIRTSIIGEEIHKNASLISWAKSQKGKQVNGFTHHLWNGITTIQYAKICEDIINNDWYNIGLFHVHAKDDVSKAQMLNYFNEKYDLKLNIIETNKIGNPVDRTIRTTKDLCYKLEIPTVQKMINNI